MSDALPTTPDVPRRWRWLNALLGGTIAAYLLVVAVCFVADRRAVQLATDKADSLRARGVPVTIDDLDLSIPSDAENATPAFARAKVLLDATPLANYFQTWEDERLPDDFEPILNSLTEFRVAALEATRKPRGEWYQTTMQLHYPLLSPAHMTSKGLGFIARSRARQGDIPAAMDTIAASFRIRAIMWKPPIHVLLFFQGGFALAGETAPAMRDELSQYILRATNPLNVSDIHALISRLLNESDTRTAWRHAIEGERALALYDLYGKLPPQVLAQNLWWPNVRRLGWFAGMPDVIDYSQQLADLASRVTVEATSVEPITKPGFARSLAAELRNATRSAFWRTDGLFIVLMRDRLSACVLAAALYIREQGVPPVTIYDLVPDYLPAVPIDSFDPAALPIQMRVEDMELQFFSVRSLVPRRYGETDESRYPHVFARLRLVPIDDD